MFTTATQQVRQAAMQHAAAFGLAAVVTLSILGTINQLAAAPSPNSLLATTQSTPVRS